MLSRCCWRWSSDYRSYGTHSGNTPGSTASRRRSCTARPPASSALVTSGEARHVCCARSGCTCSACGEARAGGGGGRDVPYRGAPHGAGARLDPGAGSGAHTGDSSADRDGGTGKITDWRAGDQRRARSGRGRGGAYRSAPEQSPGRSGLDVLAEEPLSTDSRAVDMPTSSSHRIPRRIRRPTDDRSVELFLDKLERFDAATSCAAYASMA